MYQNKVNCIFNLATINNELWEGRRKSSFMLYEVNIPLYSVYEKGYMDFVRGKGIGNQNNVWGILNTVN